MNRFNFILRVFKDTKKVVFNSYNKGHSSSATSTNPRSSYNNIFNSSSSRYSNKNNRFYSTFSSQQQNNNNYKNQYQYKEQEQYNFKFNDSSKNKKKNIYNENEESSKNIKKYKLGVLLSPTLLFTNTTALPETSTPINIIETTSSAEIDYKSTTSSNDSTSSTTITSTTSSNTTTTSNNPTSSVDSNSITSTISPDISSTANETTSVTLEDDEDFDKMKVDDSDDYNNVEFKQHNNNNNNNNANHNGFIDEAQDNNNNNNNNFDSFHFHTGVCVIPHPNKRHKGGEDSYFISNDNRVLGVADGVGGWGDVGIDPSEYSRKLMEGGKLASDSGQVARDPLCIMEQGYIYSQDVKGSSTCCIVVVDGNNLLAANLGDSGFLVIRNSEIIFRTREQQHAFNMPYQLGTQSIDRPIHSITSVFEVEKGDLVVMGTDGVFDNLFDDEILEIGEKNDEPYAIAKKIALRAFEIGCSTTTQTPFSKNANLNGYIYTGGKLDDITVIVGIVAEGIPQPYVSELLPLDDIKSDDY